MRITRVQVNLTNAFDDYQFRRGKIPKKRIRSATIEARVDEKSVRPTIPASLANELGVYVSGGITDGIVFNVLGRECSGDAIVKGRRVVLGFVELNKLDLKLDSGNARVVPKHPDGPVFRV